MPINPDKNFPLAVWSKIVAQERAIALILMATADAGARPLLELNLRHNRIRLQDASAAGPVDPSLEEFVALLERALSAPEGQVWGLPAGQDN